MENTKQLSQRLKEVLLYGKWIANTNYQEQLSDISWEAAKRKMGSLNSIALLTFHINYYLQGLIHVLDGGGLEIKDKYSFDLPEITSENEWHTLKNQFLENAEKFANQIEKLPESILDEVFVEEKYGSYRRNLEGMIEHSYYHLGQIVLINKMLRDSDSSI